MNYNSKEMYKGIEIDGKGNIDELIKIVSEFTGLTIYASNEVTLIDMIENPEKYYNDIEEIEKFHELKSFMNFQR
jgi:hypothetical protein